MYFIDPIVPKPDAWITGYFIVFFMLKMNAVKEIIKPKKLKLCFAISFFSFLKNLDFIFFFL